MSYFGVNGKVAEICTGVSGWRPLRSAFAERKLWVLWRCGGWIELDLPVAVVVVDGGLGSKTEGAWGVASANVCSAVPYLVLRDECLLRLFAKRSCDGALSDLRKMASGVGFPR
ncbi:unnamed protein product [Miscanthus lutarioriparius]|uniref:Uncharacterized protein n=1 Tax=Miscanthus lutarioriparius TaxID=422564 RepID=A0A811QQX0_9POAL|nr:unnamed protein product [Miscanthus lutarioriparius]